MRKQHAPQNGMPKGPQDMMILRTPVGGDVHGQTVAKVIEHISEDPLDEKQGSRYSALHRREDCKWGSSCRGANGNDRKAKFYRLTAEGRKQLVRETTSGAK